MKITQIKIGLLECKETRFRKFLNLFHDHPIAIRFIKDANNYFAEAIEYQGEYFYRVDGITVQAEQYEYERVINNPRLYYFSSALKLHHRILKAKELGLSHHWPTSPAAPVDIFNLPIQLKGRS